MEVTINKECTSIARYEEAKLAAKKLAKMNASDILMQGNLDFNEVLSAKAEVQFEYYASYVYIQAYLRDHCYIYAICANFKYNYDEDSNIVELTIVDNYVYSAYSYDSKRTSEMTNINFVTGEKD